MTEQRAVLAGALGLTAVIVLGLAAGELGGVTIRSASRAHAVRELGLSTTTLVPGVPVRLTAGETAFTGREVLVLRGPAGSVPGRAVSPREAQLGVWLARVPCELPADASDVVRLLLLDEKSMMVLAQSRALRLLAPGPDCAW